MIKDGDEEDEGMVKAGNLNRHTKNVMAEPMVKSGLAAALQMARSNNYVQGPLFIHTRGSYNCIRCRVIYFVHNEKVPRA